jgi:hypothetical protein
MTDETEKAPIEILRSEISKECPMLPDYKVIEMCDHYGIEYQVLDTNSYRLFTILAAAENRLLKAQK